MISQEAQDWNRRQHIEIENWRSTSRNQSPQGLNGRDVKVLTSGNALIIFHRATDYMEARNKRIAKAEFDEVYETLLPQEKADFDGSMTGKLFYDFVRELSRTAKTFNAK